jgi:hypothetical protein
MNDLTVKKVATKQVGHYHSGEVEITLPLHDTDVNLVLPNGDTIALQYRVEGPSIDVVLPYDTSVTNWKGEDMEDAPKCGKECIRLAKQLVIDLKSVDHRK